MPLPSLPLSTLPAWATLNDTTLLDITISPLSDASKGQGVLTTRSPSSKDTFDVPTLMIILHELVLCAETIAEAGKVDRRFGELVGLAGGTLRKDVMLFLLMQMGIAAAEHGKGSRAGLEGVKGAGVGVSGPWTEYVRLLPAEVPLPTTWSEEERELLRGTSLEPALSAKLASLSSEYDALHAHILTLPWSSTFLSPDASLPLTLSRYTHLDALYRSRCLQLPHSGPSLVPCLDFLNHSSAPNAYYEEDVDGNVTVLLRPGIELKELEEMCIDYGLGKGGAEMLFSYGFVDSEDDGVAGEGSRRDDSMVLPLEPMEGDPLGKAKKAAFPGPATLKIKTSKEERLEWEASSAYLMVLNEEDGLEFKVLQQTDGSTSSLRVFWRGEDVTDKTAEFEILILGLEMENVYRLRVVAFLGQRLGMQLQRLEDVEEYLDLDSERGMVRECCRVMAARLRRSERKMLREALQVLEEQKSKLLESEAVIKYLESMQGDAEEPSTAEAEETESVDAEDFS